MTSPKHLLDKQTDDAAKANPSTEGPKHERDHLETFFKALSVIGAVSLAGIVLWHLINTFLIKNSKHIANAELLICGG